VEQLLESHRAIPSVGANLVIDLDESRRNQAVLASELVQRRRYEELKSQVQRHLNNFNSEKTEPPHPYGTGWVSFIDGTRGAGKSTFLTAVLQGFREDSTLLNQLAVMDLTDPSRVERSEIILLAILRLLQKRLDKTLSKQRNLEDEDAHEGWRKAFKRVAGGLSLFAPKHHPLDGLDPELFLDWGLERAGHSADLRQNLHLLFASACKLLRVKALMFAFDDADTDATHAINLLECIRKYLDTPQVMVVVTGDMELYSLLVRQHFSRSVIDGQSAVIHPDRGFFDRDRRAQHQRMLGHLEEQYLLKLFPLQERQNLLPLWSLLQVAEAQSCVYVLRSEAWGSATIEVREMVTRLLRQGLRLKSVQDIEIFKEFLLKQPLRSVLQILSRCSTSFSHSVGTERNEKWSPDLSNELASGLRSMALTSLYRYGVDTDSIAARELPALTDAVFELAMRDGDVDTAPYLRPTSADQDIKNCFAALAAEVPCFLNGKPGALLRYLCYGPGSVSLYDTVRKRQLKDASGESTPLEIQFRRYMGIGRKESALNWARYATAVIGTPHAINPTTRVVRTGVIGLNQSRVGNYQAARKAIGDTVKSEPKSPFPAFALSLVDVSGTGGRTFSSIFNIVGLIERLLEIPDPNPDAVARLLRRAYPTLSVSTPVWESGTAISAQEIDDNADPTDESGDWDSAMTLLATHITDWLNDVAPLRSAVSPSAILIGKIWTRFYFSLEKASDDLRGNRKTGVATLMEIFALCVINAFLVEEMDHHLASTDRPNESPPGYDRNNPRTSAGSYVGKLSKLAPSREELPLTAIIATCPLLLGLLNEANPYPRALAKLFPDDREIGKLLCAKKRWGIFEKIAVQGPKAKADEPAQSGNAVADGEKRKATKYSGSETTTESSDSDDLSGGL